jgi:DNA-binding MarR family transcriptional regulator
VLAFLFSQARPVPIKAVVEQVGRVKSTVTAMINTLERHGYVHKSACQTDNRVTYVELTRKGRRFRKDFDDISKLLLKRVYGDIEEKDRHKLVGQLEKIEQNLRK